MTSVPRMLHSRVIHNTYSTTTRKRIPEGRVFSLAAGRVILSHCGPGAEGRFQALSSQNRSDFFHAHLTLSLGAFTNTNDQTQPNLEIFPIQILRHSYTDRRFEKTAYLPRVRHAARAVLTYRQLSGSEDTSISLRAAPRRLVSLPLHKRIQRLCPPSSC